MAFFRITSPVYNQRHVRLMWVMLVMVLGLLVYIQCVYGFLVM